MNITVNGEAYNKASVHSIFKQGRDEIQSHNIPDEKGFINNALYYTELVTHLLGSLSELHEFITKH